MMRVTFAKTILLAAIAFAAASSLGLAGTKPAAAAENATPAKPAAEVPAQNWSVSCVSRSRLSEANCSVEQRVLIRETGQLLGRLLIKTGANDPGPGNLLLQVPLGISIRAGLKLKVDDADIETLDIQTCDTAGCYAGGPVSGKLLDAARAGKQLKAEFSDTQQRVVTVNFVLDGFSAAFDDIK